MTNFEVIQRVQALYSKGTASDDSRLSNRLIYSKAIGVRARLLVQQGKQKEKISSWSYQTLKCIKLELAPIHECPEAPTGCEILKSKFPIPRVLSDLNRHMIKFVSTLDGKIIFDESSWEGINDSAGNRFTGSLPQYYIKDEYLYLSVNVTLKLVTIGAIFGDPGAVEDLNAICTGQQGGCEKLLDKEFPADVDMIDTIVRLASDELVLLFSQMAEDKISNASDDTSPIKMPRRSDKYMGE